MTADDETADFMTRKVRRDEIILFGREIDWRAETDRVIAASEPGPPGPYRRFTMRILYEAPEEFVRRLRLLLSPEINRVVSFVASTPMVPVGVIGDAVVPVNLLLL